MNRSSREIAFEIFLGVLAAALFIGLVVLLGWNLWAGAFFAALLYLGAKLAFSAKEESDADSEKTILQEILKSLPEIENRTIRKKVSDICDTAQRILSRLETKPEASAQEFVFQQSLQSALHIVRQYASVSRYEEQSESIRQSAEKFEELLETIHERFRSLLEHLMDEDAAGFEAEVEVLKEQLKPGMEINLPPFKEDAE